MEGCACSNDESGGGCFEWSSEVVKAFGGRGRAREKDGLKELGQGAEGGEMEGRETEFQEERSGQLRAGVAEMKDGV